MGREQGSVDAAKPTGGRGSSGAIEEPGKKIFGLPSLVVVNVVALLTGLVALSLLDVLPIGVLGVALTALGALLVFGFSSEVASERTQEAAKAADVDDAVAKLRQEMSLPNLIDFNRKEIERYHFQTRNRARWSFFISVFAMTAGLAFLVAGAVVVVREESTDVQIAAGAVSALGAALSSYVTSTFMKAHRESLAQLNFYFRQPLVTSYILTAERLSDSMPEAEKAATRQLIIERLLDALVAVPDSPPRVGRIPRRKEQSEE